MGIELARNDFLHKSINSLGQHISLGGWTVHLFDDQCRLRRNPLPVLDGLERSELVSRILISIKNIGVRSLGLLDALNRSGISQGFDGRDRTDRGGGSSGGNLRELPLDIDSAKLPRVEEVYTERNKVSDIEGLLDITGNIQEIECNISHSIDFGLGSDVSVVDFNVLDLSHEALLSDNTFLRISALRSFIKNHNTRD